MLNSPYGRLMRAIRENEVTVSSVGKNLVGIRRNILMFASGVTALSGCLLAFYFSYVNEANYQRALWTYWPWLMLILGGPGNNAGTFLGTALITAVRRIIIVSLMLCSPSITSFSSHLFLTFLQTPPELPQVAFSYTRSGPHHGVPPECP